MKRIALLFAALIVLAMATPASAHHRTRVEVMSQNLYIGADLSRLLGDPFANPPVPPEPPAALLETVQQTDYPSRAVEIAEAIDDFNPDLLGLQEVTLFNFYDANFQLVAQIDYLAILMNEISAVGENYHEGPGIRNADVTLPAEGVLPLPNGEFVEFSFAQVIDRDVIIYRDGVTVSDEQMGNFGTNFTIPAGVLGEDPVVFTRGWVSVDAHVNGQDFRFVNTHLEVSPAEGGLCAGGNGSCQDAQAEELIGQLANETLPIVLVGDFNAVPGAPAYNIIADDGYVDTWLERYPYNNEPGFTCCQSETLDNVENQLFERIDHIFIRELNPTFVVTTVVGDWDQRKTPSGLWYSDHGGPWARLYLPNS